MRVVAKGRMNRKGWERNRQKKPKLRFKTEIEEQIEQWALNISRTI
jgi:hypothetical protein